jgi:hypothetical protein
MLLWLGSTVVFLLLWFVSFTYVIGIVTDVPYPSRLLKYFVGFIVLLSIIFFISTIFSGTVFMLFLFQKIAMMLV